MRAGTDRLTAQSWYRKLPAVLVICRSMSSPFWCKDRQLTLSRGTWEQGNLDQTSNQYSFSDIGQKLRNFPWNRAEMLVLSPSQAPGWLHLSAAPGAHNVSNVDSNVSSRGLWISQVEVQIYPMLSFLTRSTCVYTIYSPSSDLIMEFLRMRELRKIHRKSETTKQVKISLYSQKVWVDKCTERRKYWCGLSAELLNTYS